jgi:uncharacterized protein YcbK (DUF882 family)
MKSPKQFLAIAMLVAAPLLAAVSFPTLAEGADVVHVVQKGEKIDELAKKYGVTAKAIATANKLKDPSHLKAGVKLTIPGAKQAGKPAAKTYEGKPKHAGRVTLVRFGSAESQTIQLVTKKGKLVPGVLPRVARMMRFGKLNIEHPIDPKLVQLVAQVSDHFGGRNIEIISGFRPKTLTQYTPHSNHNIGKAIDLRIPGVPNEVVRDHCRTYKNTGVGYYPNSLFVHFDVRAKSTFWVDLSKPGEAPKYVGKDTDVDHSVDDAMDVDDPASASSSTATDKPAEKPPGLPAPAPAASASSQK